MKIPATLKIGDAIEVIWVDASSYEHGSWCSETVYLEDTATAEIKTIGAYLCRSKETIKLCGNRQQRDGYITRIGAGFEIPVGCIKSVRRLK